MYRSTKTYCHNVGLSCAFRQWRAESHCQFLHGYALEFNFVFEAIALDERNWVVDFGNLKGLKKNLEFYFDHKTLVASDDPALFFFNSAKSLKVLQLIVVDNVGCEAFAERACNLAKDEIEELDLDDRIKVISAEVKEHGSNSGIYLG